MGARDHFDVSEQNKQSCAWTNAKIATTSDVCMIDLLCCLGVRCDDLLSVITNLEISNSDMSQLMIIVGWNWACGWHICIGIPENLAAFIVPWKSWSNHKELAEAFIECDGGHFYFFK